MTRRERVIRGRLASEHIVQFFDTTGSLAKGVGGYLHEGLENGECLLVVAKPTHRKAIAAALRHRAGVSRLADKMTMLDAGRALGGFMQRGLPDSVLFHRTIGDLVEKLSRSDRGLRIYGEMVEILAEEGNFHAAERLEELWNELAVRHSFRLLCGYSAAHFASNGGRESLAGICHTHTHVRGSDADPLAQWMLNRNHGSNQARVPGLDSRALSERRLAVAGRR